MATSALLLTSCVSTTTGSPSTPGGESISPSSEKSDEAPKPSRLAPEVKNPLDVSAFSAEPCRALSDAQVSELGLGPGVLKSDEETGESCLWKNTESAVVDLNFLTTPGGLDFVYQNRQTDPGYYKYFVEMPAIDGFPTVAASVADGRKSTGDCHLFLGTSEDSVISLSTAPSLTKIGQVEACEITTRVAGMILRTVKAGG
ncbi:DUF3558 domain-containing protein [Actinokineospora sp. G85]|uniref:DUF3558 domain-containing protein n=1 Tax=Actinokineospora sp. G85 TaxID=3406626 RepID=UPI003C7543D0